MFWEVTWFLRVGTGASAGMGVGGRAQPASTGGSCIGAEED
jgi:hypothetical protein